MTEVAADKALTPKQEAFARKFLELGDKTAAYRAAYAAGGMQAKSVNIAAHKLAKQPNVAARIAELNADAVTKAELTREDILRGLKVEAGTAKEGSARVRSWELLGKAIEGGMFTDRTATEEKPQKSIDELQGDIATSLGGMPLSMLEAYLAQLLQVIAERKGKATERTNMVPIQSALRWSHIVGQFGGEVKVYSVF